MFSVFKKNRDQGVPAWASFFTIKEYNTFIFSVEEFLKRNQIKYSIGEGIIDFGKDNPIGFESMGLSNVAQGCKNHELSDYEGIVSGHFEAMLRNKAFETELHDIIDDFEHVKQYLAIRIYDNHYISHVGRENVIGYEVADDLFAMLVLDLPESITNVQLKHSEKWNKSNEELIALGKANIQANYQFPIFKQEIDNIDFYVVITDHFFSPNIYFELDKHPELIGLHGSIISFPHRHTTLIYPIDNLNVVNVIHHMVTMTYGMNMEGPGSISNKIYWSRNNSLSEITYNFEHDKMVITPSKELVDLLNQLGEQDEKAMLN